LWYQVGHPPSPTRTAGATSTGLPTGGRNRVEHSVGRLKQFRRVATRYDKRARNYLAWVTWPLPSSGYDPLPTRLA
jgi:hypothetical protein